MRSSVSSPWSLLLGFLVSPLITVGCAAADDEGGEPAAASTPSVQLSTPAPTENDGAGTTPGSGSGTPSTPPPATESSPQPTVAPQGSDTASGGATTAQPADSGSDDQPTPSSSATDDDDDGNGEGGAPSLPTGGDGGSDDTTSASGAENTPTEQDAGATDTDVTPPNPDLEPFSFFVTSLESMRALSQNDDGFGGDLKYGEADGLTGADKICAEIAELSMTGAASKQWRAFLSTSAGGTDGGPIHAIDRIGEGPWYDRIGRLVSEDIAGLLNERPAGDAEVIEDLPNELGEPNSVAGGVEMDNHDTLTGSDETGHYDGGTCADWTSTTSTESPLAGHSWPARSGQHWIRAHGVAGCAPSVVDGEGSFGMGEEGGGVGDGGGYGGIYCFALSP